MGLHLHRAHRTDLLVSGLADVLRRPPEDAFAVDVVAVPAKGVERWLSQRLSHHLGAGAGRADGVCALVQFRTPWSLVAEVLGTRDEDPWAPEPLVWPVLAVIDDSLDEAWAAPLATHLGAADDDLRRGRRLGLAGRLAGLLSGYASQRPQMLADWERGGHSDGIGGEVPDDLAWQPPLWREVVARVGGESPTQRLERVVAAVAAGNAEIALPPRLSLFGHTRLSASDLAIVGALSSRREVHLWLPHPSPALWDALAARGPLVPVPRRLDDTAGMVAHPLLSSLGRDVRELQRTLGPLEVTSDRASVVAAEDPTSLLAWLQHDLRHATAPPGAVREARRWAPTDRSVQVHACHGPARQVDVLREVVLGLLDDDPTLEPRDILVMCPDIETYAPLIEADFGLVDVVGATAHPAHRLRVQLADRAVQQTNSMVAVLQRLLALASERATITQILDLAAMPAVRRRFSFSDDDLDKLTVWSRDAGVRWGLDRDHRASVGLDSIIQNTWAWGLDRLIAGVAMSDDSGAWIDTVLPLDDVGSSDVELAGRLAELVDRLAVAIEAFREQRTPAQWASLLHDSVVSLADVPSTDAWQIGQLGRELARLSAGSQSGDPMMRLTDVRALLADRLEGRPGRASFRTGSLTVCTMTPMRSVPHRVVALIGLDDGVFPRSSGVDGDDVLTRDPVTGERDPRSADRQLFLDAILAAQETLVVTYSGADPHTGVARPGAVPLGELLDALDVTASAPDGTRLSERVVTRHPLQPFDPRNVIVGELVPDRAFSFDRDAVEAARALTGLREPVPAFLPTPLPSPPVGDVELEALLDLVKHPVLFFLRRGRLEVSLPYDQDPLPETIPPGLDPLQQWGVRKQLLAELAAGTPEHTALGRLWRRGSLPPGKAGWHVLREVIAPQARALLAAAHECVGTGPSRTVEIDVTLGAGRRLTGAVAGVHGESLLALHAGRLKGTHRIATWVRLLALSVSDPRTPWEAYTIGRPEESPGPTIAHLPPVHAAHAKLEWLLWLHDLARTAPLPLPPKASFAYASCRHPQEALRRARREWHGTRTSSGERDDAASRIAWPDAEDLPGLDIDPATVGRPPHEHGLFGALAQVLWDPMLRHQDSGRAAS